MKMDACYFLSAFEKDILICLPVCVHLSCLSLFYVSECPGPDYEWLRTSQKHHLTLWVCLTFISRESLLKVCCGPSPLACSLLGVAWIGWICLRLLNSLVVSVMTGWCARLQEKDVAALWWAWDYMPIKCGIFIYYRWGYLKYTDIWLTESCCLMWFFLQHLMFCSSECYVSVLQVFSVCACTC